jgi:dienelactone hydrolase
MRKLARALVVTVALALVAVQLAAEAPTAHAQLRDYTIEQVSFRSDGLKILGVLGRPPGDGPFPAYISNHGSMTVQVAAQKPFTGIVRGSSPDVLVQNGYVALIVARRGYRGSEGTTTTYSTEHDYSGKKAIDVIRGAEGEANDVVAAVEFLAGLSFVDKDRIAVGGVSLGGLVSVIAASREPRIRALVSMAGGYRQGPGSGLDEAWGFVQEIWKRSAPRINGPTLLLWAKNDTTLEPDVGRDLEKRLKQAGKQVTMIVYPNFGQNGHTLFSRQEGYSIYVGDIVRFLDAHFNQ